MKNYKILFMGTPMFAKTTLEYLYNNKFNIIGCFTNPDTVSGRGMKTKISEVKQFCLDNSIKVFQPNKLKNEEVYDLIKSLDPNLIVVSAYGKILPEYILNYPKYGCINVHGSLLPSYRGAAPINHAIINGDTITGITTMYMDKGMDTGDMLLKESVDILPNDNYITLYNKLMNVGGKLIVKTLNELDNIQRIKQGDNFTLAPMIDKDFCKIDFNKSNIEIYNFVRGINAFTTMNGKKYKIHEVKLCEDFVGVVGSIVFVSKNRLVIKCKIGCIEIIKIQPENSKVLDIVSFLNGNKIEVGMKYD
ncbi:MAG: methionyl-tRNA formyltransferase [Clostridia bacterium]